MTIDPTPRPLCPRCFTEGRDDCCLRLEHDRMALARDAAPDPVIRDEDGHLVVEWPDGRGRVWATPELVEGWAANINALRDEIRHLTVASACEIELDEGRPLHEQVDRQWSRRYRADQRAWERERNELRALLAEILGRFTEHGHPGEPCLRTGWQRVADVERWRSEAGL